MSEIVIRPDQAPYSEIVIRPDQDPYSEIVIRLTTTLIVR